MPTTHVRRQIREAVATVVTGLTTTGAKVFQSRMVPQDDLPCLLVATNDEDLVRASVDDIFDRGLTVDITGCAKAAANVDDTLDAIALEVETAIAAAGNLGGLVKSRELEKIEVGFDDSLEQTVGKIRLQYRMPYFTTAGAPGVSL
jgi:hypothetical protein